MAARDPESWVSEPLRRALDGVLYRWLALFCTPVAAAALHKAFGAGPIDQAVHAGIPLFLIGYIGVHLAGRRRRNRGSPDGWLQARQVDHGTVAVARTIGLVTVIGAGLSLVAPLGTLREPRQFLMEVLLWFPLLFPLYAAAVWVTIDCARHRLGRGVEDAQHRIQQYWRQVGDSGRPPA